MLTEHCDAERVKILSGEQLRPLVMIEEWMENVENKAKKVPHRGKWDKFHSKKFGKKTKRSPFT